jgi:hypothetical protein
MMVCTMVSVFICRYSVKDLGEFPLKYAVEYKPAYAYAYTSANKLYKV